MTVVQVELASGLYFKSIYPNNSLLTSNSSIVTFRYRSLLTVSAFVFNNHWSAGAAICTSEQEGIKCAEIFTRSKAVVSHSDIRRKIGRASCRERVCQYV